MPSLIITAVTLVLASAAVGVGGDATVCIIGAGIGGSSVAHFLREYQRSSPPMEIAIFERSGVVGGRTATVEVAGEEFEAGASILHPKNLHAAAYVALLNLSRNEPSSSSSGFAIWDGRGFVFETLSSESRNWAVQKVISYANDLRLFLRYGLSLLRMQSFVGVTVAKFLKFYDETRPVFDTVDEMLRWAGLYDLTASTLRVELAAAGLSPLLVNELVTVITRINYGQSVEMSGLAGAVSLAGSGGGLWSVRGGNCQMASGLIRRSNVTLHLNEDIVSVSSDSDSRYRLRSANGETHECHVAVVATPLDESTIEFTPPISIPKRKLQHTHATFVRGLLNHEYFGAGSVSEIPELVATLEVPDVEFTSISVLKRHSAHDMTYKIFSRKPMNDSLLDSIFSVRKETKRIDWGAYPQYKAPEVFAGFVLDERHLYYVNAFENAASTMETSAVAAENIARLILKRFFTQPPFTSHQSPLHEDL